MTTRDVTTREALHRLVESIPAAQLDDAVRALEPLADPLLVSLANAPYDDEPETDEERAAAEEAWDEYARGEWTAAEDVRRELGL